MSHDSTKKTIQVALGVCAVCSVLVATATVSLEAIQNQNKKLDKIENILAAGGLEDENKNPIDIYEENIKPIIIELKSGRTLAANEYDAVLNPDKFDVKKLKGDPKYSEPIPADEDLANVKTRPKYMAVYQLVDKNKNVEAYILPIYGKGLWSTLFGFISLDKDLKTVRGITFYEHGETPGLGGEVDNKKWKATWKNKVALDDQGKVILNVIKGTVDKSDPMANSKIDGLSGATLTTRGVNNLIQYWLGENGYGPFFNKVRKGV
ncbi:MAG: Na(+)-translocating NADH-quinone reductase subunit C [Ignavibacteriales bacterium]